MRKLLTCTLLALAALLVSCSGEPKEWYADVTEWITGLPMDNTCATSRAAYLAAGSALAPQERPLPRMRKECSILLPEPADAARELPANTRVEVQSVYLVRKAATEPYTLYAELLIPGVGSSVWVKQESAERQPSLPLLLNPTSGAPLRLQLEDALEYTRKTPLPH